MEGIDCQYRQKRERKIKKKNSCTGYGGCGLKYKRKGYSYVKRNDTSSNAAKVKKRRNKTYTCLFSLLVLYMPWFQASVHALSSVFFF